MILPNLINFTTTTHYLLNPSINPHLQSISLFVLFLRAPFLEMLVLLKFHPLEPHESYLSDLCLRFLSYMFKKVIIVILQMPPTYAFYLFSM